MWATSSPTVSDTYTVQHRHKSGLANFVFFASVKILVGNSKS